MDIFAPFLPLAAAGPWVPTAVGAAAAVAVAPKAWRRLQLSRAKHRSLAGHARWSKRIAGWVPGVTHDEAAFFATDDAPADVVARRTAGMARLSDVLTRRHAATIEATRALRARIPDLAFTGRYRVPTPYAPVVQARLPVGGVLRAAHGAEVEDLDGERLIDLTGSYGVNLLGHDAYRDLMAEGQRDAAPLGMVLGSYHPCIADNVERLCRLSGQDAVSFHMSGTEAVMQAVRLARYHTGRSHLVRFCGAYHGWWEDVQPGPGNPMPPRETYTLAEMSEQSLAVLRSRGDIACVLVNPLQMLHPNRNAPGDGQLLVDRPLTPADREAYSTWLHALRRVCSERGIALIFDEVFVGFRLAPGGAQQLFGVRADFVTYGKTLGGGLPVGVVCGGAQWMKRFREDRPGDICFARGTFNAHPMVMTAMNAFLRRLDAPDLDAGLAAFGRLQDACVQRLNEALAAEGLPPRIANIGGIWTVGYTTPSHYHWMLQFYLREARLALSWVGTGRFILTLAHDDAVMTQVHERFLAAARRMAQDGWWWHDGRDARTVKRSMARQMLGRLLAGKPA